MTLLNRTFTDDLTSYVRLQQGESPQEIMSKYNELHHKELSEKRSTKICLVNVFPLGQQKKAGRMYAVLDD